MDLIMNEPQHETRAIFLEALALNTPEERASHLDAACRDKPALRLGQFPPVKKMALLHYSIERISMIFAGFAACMISERRFSSLRMDIIFDSSVR